MFDQLANGASGLFPSGIMMSPGVGGGILLTNHQSINYQGSTCLLSTISINIKEFWDSSFERYRVIFFTGPAQKSSKYGTGPAQ